MQPSRLQTGKNRQIHQKWKTWKHRKINAFGSRSGGIFALRLPANSIGQTPHWGAQIFEFEKAADEISATGGPRRLSPRPFGPEPKILPLFRFFPLPSGICPVFPVFSGFCRLFPAISAYFQTVLNWTFGVFTDLSVYCNPQGCSMVTNIDLCVLPIPEEPPDTFPADLPCSGSLHIF